jgi:pimeloyl-ACP methyl ester carboxylesterase
LNETVTGLAYVNGTRIYYEIAGSGHPVVLNHGGSLDTRMWDDQFELFARRYRVLRYDLRGYGRSAVPDGPYSRAGDLAAIMDHVDIDHAYQVGMSMGGGIVIELTLTHPGRADALVLVGSGLGRGGRWSREWRDLSETRDRITREEGVDAGNEYWLGSHIFAPALERPEVGRRVREIVMAYSGWLWLNEDPHVTPEPPPAQRLEQVHAPTLVMVGERDIPDCLRIAELLEERIPDSRKVVLPGVGHASNMEDPDSFNETVLEFLAELDRR